MAAERYDDYLQNAKARRSAYPVSGACCGHEYTCYHQVPVLEDDGEEPERSLCLPEFR